MTGIYYDVLPHEADEDALDFFVQRTLEVRALFDDSTLGRYAQEVSIRLKT